MSVFFLISCQGEGIFAHTHIHSTHTHTHTHTHTIFLPLSISLGFVCPCFPDQCIFPSFNLFPFFFLYCQRVSEGNIFCTHFAQSFLRLTTWLCRTIKTVKQRYPFQYSHSQVVNVLSPSFFDNNHHG